MPQRNKHKKSSNRKRTQSKGKIAPTKKRLQVKERLALKKILRTRERPRPKPKPKSASDLQDLLVDMVINSSEKAANGTEIENLIYNTTQSTADLGYNFGFAVGRELALKLANKKGFVEVLDRIGMHNSLYHPFRDEVIITSTPSRLQRPQLNHNIHVYESGIISGYLSVAANTMVHTTERRCVFNGSESCQFFSVPLSQKTEHSALGVNGVTGAIAQVIREGQFAREEHEYYRMLSYLPLVDSTISKQILKMMIMSGEKLGASTGKAGTRHVISNIANYLGARDFRIERRGMKSIIKLRYESYNSMKDFVSIGAALITGFSTSIGRVAQVSFVTNKDKSYTTVIETDIRKI